MLPFLDMPFNKLFSLKTQYISLMINHLQGLLLLHFKWNTCVWLDEALFLLLLDILSSYMIPVLYIWTDDILDNNVFLVVFLIWRICSWWWEIIPRHFSLVFENFALLFLSLRAVSRISDSTGAVLTFDKLSPDRDILKGLGPIRTWVFIVVWYESTHLIIIVWFEFCIVYLSA